MSTYASANSPQAMKSPVTEIFKPAPLWRGLSEKKSTSQFMYVQVTANVHPSDTLAASPSAALWQTLNYGKRKAYRGVYAQCTSLCTIFRVSQSWRSALSSWLRASEVPHWPSNLKDKPVPLWWHVLGSSEAHSSWWMWMCSCERTVKTTGKAHAM